MGDARRSAAMWGSVLLLCAGCNGSEVCYPGPSGDFGTCVSLADASDVFSRDYDYPDPLNDSAQYSRPVRFLDLTATPRNTAVAENFVLSELAQQSKGRFAIVQAHAVERLQELRDELGVLQVNSGYRSPGYNAGIDGSATYSRHTYGDAFDLAPAEASLDDLADACDSNGAGFVNVYQTHIHCDWRDDDLDFAFYGDATGRPNAPDVTGSVRRAPVLDQDATIVRADGGELRAPATGWPEGEPLREWTAYDAAGEVIEQVRSTTYVPPVQAVEVEVEIGLRLVRTMRLRPTQP